MSSTEVTALRYADALAAKAAGLARIANRERRAGRVRYAVVYQQDADALRLRAAQIRDQVWQAAR